MESLKKECEEAISSLGYALCLVKKFRPDAPILEYALGGISQGFIETDGFVAQPVHFVNYITNEDDCISVKRIDYKKDELTEDTNIVMWKYKDDIQFVIMNKDGDVIWDPSGNSDTVKYGEPVSIRRFITKQNIG